MLTGCDYDPTYCEQGPSFTGAAVVILALFLGIAILIEVAHLIWNWYQKRDEKQESWLD
jgi:hypothetical protein